jgi:hypothetical protein
LHGRGVNRAKRLIQRSAATVGGTETLVPRNMGRWDEVRATDPLDAGTERGLLRKVALRHGSSD